MIQKPSRPKGTRDFSPVEMAKRNYIFNTIREVFSLYGFKQIETPALENLSTLMGKYGEEGDKLVCKILNSGEFTQKVTDEELLQRNHLHLAARICEKGLRYDLTVPVARFVVMHRDELQLPFKRYQMQPVWRADRPQKGRYREFYQCDVDIIGSNSMLNEAELVEIAGEVFAAFGIPVVMKVNNRKVLSGIAEIIGSPDKVTDLCTAIDKLDKIGRDNVCKEILERGISEESLKKLNPFFEMSGTTNSEKLQVLKSLLNSSEVGLAGIEELETLLEYTIEIDITLARGLNYYTGAIFEAKARNVSIGSILGGGRYDNLTGIFGLKDMSGVGVSFGAERIYDVLNELDLFPKHILTPITAMFLNFGGEDETYALNGLSVLRRAGIPSEIYPDSIKIGKQMNYANAKGIPFVVMAGENERAEGLYTLKNMLSGEQKLMTIEEIAETVKK